MLCQIYFCTIFGNICYIGKARVNPPVGRSEWKVEWFFELSLQRRSKVRLNDVTTQVIHFRPHLINWLTSQRNEFQKSRAINISVYRRLEEFRESSETRELPAKSNEIRLTELVPEETYVAVFVEGIERKRRRGKWTKTGRKLMLSGLLTILRFTRCIHILRSCFAIFRYYAHVRTRPLSYRLLRYVSCSWCSRNIWQVTCLRY